MRNWVRRFEIELYWKRSAYFWTFIALAFAGYGALQVQVHETAKMKGLDFLLANVGFVASAAWFLVNRGSKYWQEHWETQVDRLENGAAGPLYGIVIARVDVEKKVPLGKRLKAWWCRLVISPKQWMTGAPRLPKSGKDQVKSLSVPSVSKINQLGSLYVAIVWIILGVRALLGPKFCVEIYGWSVSFPGVFFGLTLVSLDFFAAGERRSWAITPSPKIVERQPISVHVAMLLTTAARRPRPGKIQAPIFPFIVP